MGKDEPKDGLQHDLFDVVAGNIDEQELVPVTEAVGRLGRILAEQGIDEDKVVREF
jgi:hypothetical protein